jgi:Domain of unknown function (DUF4440)
MSQGSTIHMRTIVGIISAVLTTLAVAQAQNNPAAKPASPLETTLVANERALYDAVVKGDKAAFQSLVVADGVWAHKTGFLPMNLMADGLAYFTVTTWDIVNPHVTPIDDSAAIVMYSLAGAGTVMGQPVAPYILASTVWVRRDGKWRAVHHQETDLTK